MTEQDKSNQPPEPTGNVFLDILRMAEFNATYQRPVQHIKPTSTEVVPRGYRTIEMVQKEEGIPKRKPKKKNSRKRISPDNSEPKK